MALPKIIAIDGPGGSGKSTICAAVARDLGYLFVDTGGFYRAVTLAALRANLVQADEASVVRLTEQVKLDITADRDADDRDYTIFLNGEDITTAVQQPPVDSNVSRIAAMGGVRTILNLRYRELAHRGQVIMAGRDIGTVVLPDADLKIYLDASPEARAERRYRQRVAAGQPADYGEILNALRSRDAYDSQRAIAPMRQAADALYLNTDHLSIEAAIERVRQIILDWRPPH
ncbi:MAG: (d)CMP kinase [Anaerolineae bacterium]|nr:(d)CMP kinase [Anaerolineae bacterium]